MCFWKYAQVSALVCESSSPLPLVPSIDVGSTRRVLRDNVPIGVPGRVTEEEVRSMR